MKIVIALCFAPRASGNFVYSPVSVVFLFDRRGLFFVVAGDFVEGKYVLNVSSNLF